MATFNATTRVQVSDQSSQYRNHYGTVESRDGANHQVRIDGHPIGKTQLFLGKQLRSTTQLSPVTYDE